MKPAPAHLPRVLGIETSCDESAAAVYDAATGLRSHCLYSQVATHAPWGGVVPELASRDHIRKLLPLIRTALDEAGVEGHDLDAVAYTAGPGLAGALLVGATMAVGLAMAWRIPAIPVHHMEAHLLAAQLEADPPAFPFVALLVSGGHSLLVRVDRLGGYRVLGETLDDAAGEAFDKGAKLLGLPYPGGPQLARLAAGGRPGVYRFPRPMQHDPGLDMSFSGLKTALATRLQAVQAAGPLTESVRADLANAYQEAIVDSLVGKAVSALHRTGLKRLVVSGGVGANALLRERLREAAGDIGARVYYPRIDFCTDNGAMIALAGSLRYRPGRGPGDLEVVARPRWSLEELAGMETGA